MTDAAIFKEKGDIYGKIGMIVLEQGIFYRSLLANGRFALFAYALTNITRSDAQISIN